LHAQSGGLHPNQWLDGGPVRNPPCIRICDWSVHRKRLTNTPVRPEGSVLQCLDDRKNRVVSTQATDTSRSSAVGGRVHEQRYAAERVLPESRIELQHSGSPSKEATLEEKAQAKFLSRSFGASGVGGEEIANATRADLWLG